MDVLEVVHLWDDMVDGDKSIAAANANAAMRKAMIDLPSNPFWFNNSGILQPILQSCYLQWIAANVLEKEQQAGDVEKAYMLRASVYQLFHIVAALCGGMAWAEQIAPEIYRLYGETVKDVADA